MCCGLCCFLPSDAPSAFRNLHILISNKNYFGGSEISCISTCFDCNYNLYALHCGLIFFQTFRTQHTSLDHFFAYETSIQVIFRDIYYALYFGCIPLHTSASLVTPDRNSHKIGIFHQKPTTGGDSILGR